MNDLKITISRSFARKVNLGNYESADFFANYSHEALVGLSKDDLSELSDELYVMAKKDVEKSMAEYQNKFGNVDPETRAELEKTDWKLQGLYDRVRKGETIMFSDWDNLTKSQQDFLHKAQLLRAQEVRLEQKDVEIDK